MSQEPATGARMSRGAVVDRYFLEHRAKLLDVAAFLDRVDRAAPAPGEPAEDDRVAALRAAAAVLLEAEPGRARRMLQRWSDLTHEPVASAGELPPVAGVAGVGRDRA